MVSLSFKHAGHTGHITVPAAIERLAGFTLYLSGVYRKGSEVAELVASDSDRALIRAALAAK